MFFQRNSPSRVEEMPRSFAMDTKYTVKHNKQHPVGLKSSDDELLMQITKILYLANMT
jgi:hypothetical protein